MTHTQTPALTSRVWLQDALAQWFPLLAHSISYHICSTVQCAQPKACSHGIQHRTSRTLVGFILLVILARWSSAPSSLVPGMNEAW